MADDLVKSNIETFISSTRADFVDKSDRSGTEEIGRDELRLPRLAIAQGLSPQITPDSSQYIEGLKLFDLFNDLTGEIYGRGPFLFITIRRDVRRIEFIPRSDGGGVRDMNVPLGDPRNEWSTDETTGERRPPSATKFVEFVIFLMRPNRAPEPIVLSIKDTNKFNRRAHERLTGFIKLRNAAIYEGIYKLRSMSEKNDNGTFGVYVIENAGFLNDKTLYNYCREFHESLKGKQIIVDREEDIENSGDPDVPF
jgi:hypothetical protein